MATIQEQISTLESQIEGMNTAITDGVRQVTIGGQTVTYNTIDSLIRARDDAQKRLNALQEQAAGKVRNRRTLAFYGGRGYNDRGC